MFKVSKFQSVGFYRVSSSFLQADAGKPPSVQRQESDVSLGCQILGWCIMQLVYCAFLQLKTSLQLNALHVLVGDGANNIAFKPLDHLVFGDD